SAALTELYKLREGAIARISSHLNAKLNVLRQPRTNVHIIQQSDLLKSSELYIFLLDHNPSAAVAFKNLYTQAMSDVYVQLFRTYVQQLKKMQGQSRDGATFGLGGVNPATPGAAVVASLGVGGGIIGDEIELLASRESS
ncbi:vps52 sac2 family protein, partial [Cystoisospora suis]